MESYLHNAEWLSKQGLQVVHGLIQDCLELLPMADAVVTDPPYGMGSYASDQDVRRSRDMKTLFGSGW